MESFLPAIERLDAVGVWVESLVRRWRPANWQLIRVQPRIERMLQKTEAGAMVRHWFRYGTQSIVSFRLCKPMLLLFLSTVSIWV